MDRSARADNTHLNADLAQIDYVFSDKTGMFLVLHAESEQSQVLSHKTC